MLSPLSKVTSLENTSQFKLVIDSTSNRVNGLLRHNSIPVTLYDNWLTFRDKGKIFALTGDLLKTIASRNYKVDIASSSIKK